VAGPAPEKSWGKYTGGGGGQVMAPTALKIKLERGTNLPNRMVRGRRKMVVGKYKRWPPGKGRGKKIAHWGKGKGSKWGKKEQKSLPGALDSRRRSP